MLNTTLCYITRGDQVLMLHRVKKQNDVNKDKWIGVGGKFLEDESPDECLLREVREETGLKLTSWRCRGIVTFLTNGDFEGEYMYLFTADEKIEVTAEELEEEYKKIGEQYNMPVETVKQYIREDDLRLDVAVGKAVDEIKAAAVIENA